MQGECPALNFITDQNKCYLGRCETMVPMDLRPKDRICGKLLYDEKGVLLDVEGHLEELALFHIDEITFDDKAPRKEALENVLGALNLQGIHFVYLICGDSRGVHFYVGISRDLSVLPKKDDLVISDIGRLVLQSSFTGNFRGSRIRLVSPHEKKKIVERVSTFPRNCCLEGVPGINKDNEKYQGVDRLVDVMLGDTFAVMVIAKPLDDASVSHIEQDLFRLYGTLFPLAKQNVQTGSNSGTGSSVTSTTSTSKSEGWSGSYSSQESTGESSQSQSGTSSSISKGTNSSTARDQTTKGGNESSSNGKSESISKGNTKSRGESRQWGSSGSTNTGDSRAEGQSASSGVSNSMTMEFSNRSAQEWLNYLDEVILKRLDYGKGKGLFVSAIALMTENKGSLIKLENTMKSLFSGESGNKVPLRKLPLEEEDPRLTALRNFQIPRCCALAGDDGEGLFAPDEVMVRAALSQVTDKNMAYVGSWLSTNELGLIAGLPKKDIVGLSLREEVDFGLNYQSKTASGNKILLGKLVQSGNVLEGIDVCLDKDNLNKHTFITGVTGSGKTTTCLRILNESGLPFMVIEPAKTEYRILKKKYGEDLLVFTLGKDTAAPFRLNPLEFFPHENITSRVDMFKASLEAAFDMEAAIPQIIESAIYECYKDYGWNIARNVNERYGERAFDDGVYAFPTLTDLLNKIETVVDEQGFDERLKHDYIGSIKARLLGLTVGSKGLMLNTRRSVDFKDLLERRVVLELEEIRSSSEKSLIMGFVLTNLTEAVKAKYHDAGNREFHHILLVEEAHRLLSKYMPGDSLNKKQGVETFTDMLAEVRKYGECLMIVDQIPAKLTPEILKNTNTKIVHKIFAQDDKDAIGNTIALTEEQKGFLSNLETGRAVAATQGWPKALQIQVLQEDEDICTTGSGSVEDEELRKTALEYYRTRFRKGIFPGLKDLREEPDGDTFEQYLWFAADESLAGEYRLFFKNVKPSEALRKMCKDAAAHGRIKSMAAYLKDIFYAEERTSYAGHERYISLLEQWIEDVAQDKLNGTKRMIYADSLNIRRD